MRNNRGEERRKINTRECLDVTETDTERSERLKERKKRGLRDSQLLKKANGHHPQNINLGSLSS